MPLEEVPPGRVWAEVRDALADSDRLVADALPAEYHDHRLQLHDRARRWADDTPSWWAGRQAETLTDDERRRLVEDFLQGQGASGEQRESEAHLADLFLDFGVGTLPAGPLGWNPLSVRLFMTAWLPRKVTLAPADQVLLPEVLRAFVRYALATTGVDEQWWQPVVDAVDEAEPRMHEALDDPTSFGPAKQMVTWLVEHGYDPGDEASMTEGVAAYNASLTHSTGPGG